WYSSSVISSRLRSMFASQFISASNPPPARINTTIKAIPSDIIGFLRERGSVLHKFSRSREGQSLTRIGRRRRGRSPGAFRAWLSSGRGLYYRNRGINRSLCQKSISFRSNRGNSKRSHPSGRFGHPFASGHEIATQRDVAGRQETDRAVHH